MKLQSKGERITLICSYMRRCFQKGTMLLVMPTLTLTFLSIYCGRWTNATQRKNSHILLQWLLPSCCVGACVSLRYQEPCRRGPKLLAAQVGQAWGERKQTGHSLALQFGSQVGGKLNVEKITFTRPTDHFGNIQYLCGVWQQSKQE